MSKRTTKKRMIIDNQKNISGIRVSKIKPADSLSTASNQSKNGKSALPTPKYLKQSHMKA